ncbi:hypothetical protein [Nitrosophilus kaiyonis]|uniref:hypothetical protein n=1 Tax=Nitrosophilus kaiyonis TaxID=2930200 RepID=UPI0024913821|nr:hypothetical protein [Nitrosophilus kaiyonis]
MKKNTKYLIGVFLNLLIDLFVISVIAIILTAIYIWVFSNKHLLPLYILITMVGIIYGKYSQKFRKHDIFGKTIQKWIDKD